MKRILKITLFVSGLIALVGLAAIAPRVMSLAGVQAVAQADTVHTVTLDVSMDCNTFNYLRAIPLAQIVRGDSYIANGKIFPAGALVPGINPNGPGSIGTWVSRGTSTATLAEHLANPSSYGVFETAYFLLNDGRALVTEGWFKPEGTGRSAVTGGMGGLSGVSGEVSGVEIGANSTGCPNTRYTFHLEKQGRK